MNIEEIILEKPHMNETLRLYEKVMEFSAAVSRLSRGGGFEDIAYPPELADAVIKAFSASFAIPEESLSPLREAMKNGGIDFTRFPLNELPSFSLPYHHDETGMILFLISRPFFFRRREGFLSREEAWERGKCPVCSAKPSLASLGEDGKRKLHCSYCGGSGHYRRIGCPSCSIDDASTLNIFTVDGEPGYRIDACDACRSYVKTVTGTLSENSLDADIADLISLPLDLIAQGKGYRRHSPNPIGMISMG